MAGLGRTAVLVVAAALALAGLVAAQSATTGGDLLISPAAELEVTASEASATSAPVVVEWATALANPAPQLGYLYFVEPLAAPQSQFDAALGVNPSFQYPTTLLPQRTAASPLGSLLRFSTGSQGCEALCLQRSTCVSFGFEAPLCRMFFELVPPANLVVSTSSSNDVFGYLNRGSRLPCRPFAGNGRFFIPTGGSLQGTVFVNGTSKCCADPATGQCFLFNSEAACNAAAVTCASCQFGAISDSCPTWRGEVRQASVAPNTPTEVTVPTTRLDLDPFGAQVVSFQLLEVQDGPAGVAIPPSRALARITVPPRDSPFGQFRVRLVSPVQPPNASSAAGVLVHEGDIAKYSVERFGAGSDFGADLAFAFESTGSADGRDTIVRSGQTVNFASRQLAVPGELLFADDTTREPAETLNLALRFVPPTDDGGAPLAQVPAKDVDSTPLRFVIQASDADSGVVQLASETRSVTSNARNAVSILRLQSAGGASPPFAEALFEVRPAAPAQTPRASMAQGALAPGDGVAFRTLTVRGAGAGGGVALDFETQPEVAVSYKASPAATEFAQLRVRVTDAPEAPTAIRTTSPTPLFEDRNLLNVRLASDDPDQGDRHCYQVLASTLAGAAVREDSSFQHSLEFTRPFPDFDRTPTATVTLRSIDTAGLFLDQELTFDVQDSGDMQLTVGLVEGAVGLVQTDAAVGTVVGTVAVSDVDGASTPDFDIAVAGSTVFNISGSAELVLATSLVNSAPFLTLDVGLTIVRRSTGRGATRTVSVLTASPPAAATSLVAIDPVAARVAEDASRGTNVSVVAIRLQPGVQCGNLVEARVFPGDRLRVAAAGVVPATVNGQPGCSLVLENNAAALDFEAEPSFAAALALTVDVTAGDRELVLTRFRVALDDVNEPPVVAAFPAFSPAVEGCAQIRHGAGTFGQFILVSLGWTAPMSLGRPFVSDPEADANRQRITCELTNATARPGFSFSPSRDLVYDPAAANLTAPGPITFAFFCRDDGQPSRTSPTRTFSVFAFAVNRAPAFSGAAARAGGLHAVAVDGERFLVDVGSAPLDDDAAFEVLSDLPRAALAGGTLMVGTTLRDSPVGIRSARPSVVDLVRAGQRLCVLSSDCLNVVLAEFQTPAGIERSCSLLVRDRSGGSGGGAGQRVDRLGVAYTTYGHRARANASATPSPALPELVIEATEPDADALSFRTVASQVPLGLAPTSALSAVAHLGSAANFEVAARFDARLAVTESGQTPPLSAYVNLHVDVLDTNDPITNIELSAAQVPENQAGVTVGILSVQDEDANQRHTFRVTNGQTSLFRIEGNRLILNQSVDFESTTGLLVAIEATEDIPIGSSTAQRSFAIAVVDTNDAPRDVSLALVQPSGRLEVPVTAGPTVVGTLSATDPDATDAHVFSLTEDATGGAFAIDGTRLVLVDARAVASLITGRFSIGVRATDKGGLSVTRVFGGIQILTTGLAPPAPVIDAFFLDALAVSEPVAVTMRFPASDLYPSQAVAILAVPEVAGADGAITFRGGDILVDLGNQNFTDAYARTPVPVRVTVVPQGRPAAPNVTASVTLSIVSGAPTASIAAAASLLVPEGVPLSAARIGSLVVRSTVSVPDERAWCGTVLARVGEDAGGRLAVAGGFGRFANGNCSFDVLATGTFDFEAAASHPLAVLLDQCNDPVLCGPGNRRVIGYQALTVAVRDANDPPLALRLPTDAAPPRTPAELGRLSVVDPDTAAAFGPASFSCSVDSTRVAVSNGTLLHMVAPPPTGSLSFVATCRDQNRPPLAVSQRFTVALTEPEPASVFTPDTRTVTTQAGAEAAFALTVGDDHAVEGAVFALSSTQRFLISAAGRVTVRPGVALDPTPAGSPLWVAVIAHSSAGGYAVQHLAVTVLPPAVAAPLFFGTLEVPEDAARLSPVSAPLATAVASPAYPLIEPVVVRHGAGGMLREQALTPDAAAATPVPEIPSSPFQVEVVSGAAVLGFPSQTSITTTPGLAPGAGQEAVFTIMRLPLVTAAAFEGADGDARVREAASALLLDGGFQTGPADVELSFVEELPAPLSLLRLQVYALVSGSAAAAAPVLARLAGGDGTLLAALTSNGTLPALTAVDVELAAAAFPPAAGPPPAQGGSSGGLDGGAIAGIVIALLIVLVGIVLFVAYRRSDRRNHKLRLPLFLAKRKKQTGPGNGHSVNPGLILGDTAANGTSETDVDTFSEGFANGNRTLKKSAAAMFSLALDAETAYTATEDEDLYELPDGAQPRARVATAWQKKPRRTSSGGSSSSANSSRPGSILPGGYDTFQEGPEPGRRYDAVAFGADGEQETYDTIDTEQGHGAEDGEDIYDSVDQPLPSVRGRAPARLPGAVVAAAVSRIEEPEGGEEIYDTMEEAAPGHAAEEEEREEVYDVMEDAGRAAPLVVAEEGEIYDDMEPAPDAGEEEEEEDPLPALPPLPSQGGAALASSSETVYDDMVEEDEAGAVGAEEGEDLYETIEEEAARRQRLSVPSSQRGPALKPKSPQAVRRGLMAKGLATAEDSSRVGVGAPLITADDGEDPYEYNNVPTGPRPTQSLRKRLGSAGYEVATEDEDVDYELPVPVATPVFEEEMYEAVEEGEDDDGPPPPLPAKGDSGPAGPPVTAREKEDPYKYKTLKTAAAPGSRPGSRPGSWQGALPAVPPRSRGQSVSSTCSRGAEGGASFPATPGPTDYLVPVAGRAPGAGQPAFAEEMYDAIEEQPAAAVRGRPAARGPAVPPRRRESVGSTQSDYEVADDDGPVDYELPVPVVGGGGGGEELPDYELPVPTAAEYPDEEMYEAMVENKPDRPPALPPQRRGSAEPLRPDNGPMRPDNGLASAGEPEATSPPVRGRPKRRSGVFAAGLAKLGRKGKRAAPPPVGEGVAEDVYLSVYEAGPAQKAAKAQPEEMYFAVDDVVSRN